MFFYELETKRLELKNISFEDREFIFRQFSNDDVNMFLFDEEPYKDISEADGLIAFYTEVEPRNQHRWIITEKNSGEKLGTCGFHCYDREAGRCEIGYDLFPDYWNKGYADEALTAIIEFARKEMMLKSIVAYIYKENLRSIRLAEKHGFVCSSETVSYSFRNKDYEHFVYVLEV